MSEIRNKIGIAFSGGGARGFFHLGVVKAIQELQIKPAVVSGTSAGSLAALCISAGLKFEDVAKNLPSNPLYNLKNLSLGWKGLADLHTLRLFLEKHLEYKLLEDLPIKFVPVATNLEKGTPHAAEKGEIIPWVMASCAVPVVVNPLRINDILYVDGGLSVNLPARFIRHKCDFLVGIDLIPDSDWVYSSKAKWLEVAKRSMEISLHHNATFDRSLCDLVITTKQLGEFPMYQYKNSEALIDLGYKNGIDILSESALFNN